MRYGPLN